jgi:carbamoyl-phosphate synthase small subunit
MRTQVIDQPYVTHSLGQTPALQATQVQGSVHYGTLILEDGTTFEGKAFGYTEGKAGEVVFSTGMVGYPEALTDASFAGQILIMTYPLLGNYGVPMDSSWEADRIHVSGLIVSNYIDTPVHTQSTMTLGAWLKQQKVPALEIKDTRLLTQHIRKHGAMLGKIVFDNDIPFYDPNQDNLIAQVSTTHIIYFQYPQAGRERTLTPAASQQEKYTHQILMGQVEMHEGLQKQPHRKKTVALIDCGAKRNIVRCLLQRGLEVITVPWNYDLFSSHNTFNFDGIVISNGPGDPTKATTTINTISTALEHNIPTLGICMGNQLLTLAAGGDTYKMKFGHRSQNQPCLLENSPRCYITTQNHGFAVGTVPDGFVPWFINANDGSNEGIKHVSKPFMSVQFHPEAAPGPVDTEWIFDYFVERMQ